MSLNFKGRWRKNIRPNNYKNNVYFILIQNHTRLLPTLTSRFVKFDISLTNSDSYFVINKLLKDKSNLEKVLKKGKEKANIIAEENLKNIREKVGLI